MDWFLYDRDLRHERVEKRTEVTKTQNCDRFFILAKV